MPPFADDIADNFPEVARPPEREVLELTEADARYARGLAVRLGIPADRVVRLALALLACGGNAAREIFRHECIEAPARAHRLG